MYTNQSISSAKLISALSADGEFLHLSRFQSALFDSPVFFSLSNGTRVSIPAAGIICFEPAVNATVDLVLSSGIHGNETAPIEICDALVRQLLRGEWSTAQRVLFIFGNLPAINAGQRFIQDNMNRLFSGAHRDNGEEQNEERRRAALLENIVEDFFVRGQPGSQRLHYDLHTAIKPSKNDKFAVYPFRHGRPWNKQQLAFLLACGINTILLSGSPTTTFSYFSSSRFEADAFTVELGKVKPFGHNNMADFQAVSDCLQRLIRGDKIELKPFDNEDFLIYRVNQVINKVSEQFQFNFADSLPNFSDFAKGFLLATDGALSYYCEYDGEAIVFPNAKVEIGQRTVLTVIPTTL